MGLTEVIARTDLSSEQQELIGLIDNSTRSLLKIINDILDLSRIEAGKLTLQSQQFRLGDCVENVARLLYQKACEKGLDLELFIDPRCAGDVTADPDRLRQVLINLVGNAIKFTSYGHVAIKVESAGDASDSGIRMSIRDTGIGMDKALQDRLFTPFEQGDAAISRNYGGTGLGLSISRHIVEMMGGSMTLHSELGSGTEVSFTLPLRFAQEPDPARYKSIDGSRVLVVSRREGLQSIIVRYLQSAGAAVTVCSDHHNALELVQSQQGDDVPFDAVILSASGEELDRQEFSRRARQAAAPSDVVLVLVSSKQIRPESGKFGFDKVLPKPLLHDELLGSLAESFSTSAAIPIQAKIEIAIDEQREKLGLNVLVAEDNRVNQLVAAKYLTDLGCSFQIAENGSVAVAKSQEQAFDVILMDMRMPEMNGDTATLRIREREIERGTRSMPIIAVTANAFESDKQWCREVGMNGFLSKPYTSQQLRDLLTRFVSVDPTQSAVDFQTL
jgi:CheY-like chemotaxis protein